MSAKRVGRVNITGLLVTLHIRTIRRIQTGAGVRTDGEAIHAREAPRPESMPVHGARMRSAKPSMQSRLTDGRRSLSGRGEREMPT